MYKILHVQYNEKLKQVLRYINLKFIQNVGFNA